MVIENIEQFLEVAKTNSIIQKGNEFMISDYVFLNQKVRELEKNNIKYSIFTVIDDGDKHLYILNGVRKINRIAHIIITLTHIQIPKEGLFY